MAIGKSRVCAKRESCDTLPRNPWGALSSEAETRQRSIHNPVLPVLNARKKRDRKLSVAGRMTKPIIAAFTRNHGKSAGQTGASQRWIVHSASAVIATMRNHVATDLCLDNRTWYRQMSSGDDQRAITGGPPESASLREIRRG